MVFCTRLVPCSSTSFPWLVLFFEALLYLKLVTVSSFYPLTLISVLMPLVLSSAQSSWHWSPRCRLWRLCRDAQLIFPVLISLLLSHQCHQQSGGWWLFCLQYIPTETCCQISSYGFMNVTTRVTANSANPLPAKQHLNYNSYKLVQMSSIMNQLYVWDNCFTLEQAATKAEKTAFLFYRKQELTSVTRVSLYSGSSCWNSLSSDLKQKQTKTNKQQQQQQKHRMLNWNI